MRSMTAALVCSLLFHVASHAAENRDAKVRNDRSAVEATGLWIYNDLAQGFLEAKKSGKPLLVVLRCVP